MSQWKLMVGLILALLQSYAAFVAILQGALLAGVVASLALVRARRTQLAAAIFLVTWVGIVLASAAMPSADSVLVFVLPYLLLPVVLIASMLFSPAASLITFATTVVLYAVAVLLAGGTAILDLPMLFAMPLGAGCAVAGLS